MLQSTTPTGKPAARRCTCKLLALAPILLTLALALPAGASAFVSSGDGWFPWSSGTTANLTDVTFLDSTRGWAAGHDLNAKSGAIRAATSGGDSSPTSTPPGDPVLIWEVGNVYTVYNLSLIHI